MVVPVFLTPKPDPAVRPLTLATTIPLLYVTGDQVNSIVQILHFWRTHSGDLLEYNFAAIERLDGLVTLYDGKMCDTSLDDFFTDRVCVSHAGGQSQEAEIHSLCNEPLDTMDLHSTIALLCATYDKQAQSSLVPLITPRRVKDVCFAMLRLNHLLPHIDAAMQPGRMASRQLQAVAEQTLNFFTQPMSEKEAQYLDSVARLCVEVDDHLKQVLSRQHLPTTNTPTTCLATAQAPPHPTHPAPLSNGSSHMHTQPMQHTHQPGAPQGPYQQYTGGQSLFADRDGTTANGYAHGADGEHHGVMVTGASYGPVQDPMFHGPSNAVPSHGPMQDATLYAVRNTGGLFAQVQDAVLERVSSIGDQHGGEVQRGNSTWEQLCPGPIVGGHTGPYQGPLADVGHMDGVARTNEGHVRVGQGLKHARDSDPPSMQSDTTAAAVHGRSPVRRRLSDSHSHSPRWAGSGSGGQLAAAAAAAAAVDRNSGSLQQPDGRHRRSHSPAGYTPYDRPYSPGRDREQPGGPGDSSGYRPHDRPYSPGRGRDQGPGSLGAHRVQGRPYSPGRDQHHPSLPPHIEQPDSHGRGPETDFRAQDSRSLQRDSERAPELPYRDGADRDARSWEAQGDRRVGGGGMSQPPLIHIPDIAPGGRSGGSRVLGKRTYKRHEEAWSPPRSPQGAPERDNRRNLPHRPEAYDKHHPHHRGAIGDRRGLSPSRGDRQMQFRDDRPQLSPLALAVGNYELDLLKLLLAAGVNGTHTDPVRLKLPIPEMVKCGHRPYSWLYARYGVIDVQPEGRLAIKAQSAAPFRKAKEVVNPCSAAEKYLLMETRVYEFELCWFLTKHGPMRLGDLKFECPVPKTVMIAADGAVNFYQDRADLFEFKNIRTLAVKPDWRYHMCLPELPQ